MSTRGEATGPRSNPFEVALWTVGAVLVAAGIAGAQWANRMLSLANGGYYCDDVGNCTERYDYVLTQTTLMLAPSAVTAGLVAVVVALGLRAFAVTATRRDAAVHARVDE